MDVGEFIRNRHQVPWSEVAPYEGRYVAWAGDGRSIFASAPTEEDLIQEVQRLGVSFEECVLDYIPTPEEVTLGSWQ